MFELFPPPRQEFDPLSNYSHENYPPMQTQAEFFRYAFLESAEIDKKSRIVAGPFYNDFSAIMQETDAMIKLVNPNFTIEHIAPDSYRSPRARKEVDDSRETTRPQLFEIARQRLALTDKLASGKIVETMHDQLLVPETLKVPRYCKQEEGWGHIDAARGCANACFRMVFGEIAGWTPSEAAVGNQLVKLYGTAVVDDSVFNNVYNTEIFSEICDKSVVSIELIGADFELIASLTQKVKQRQENADVFCVVNMASKAATRNIWHTSVLLEADLDSVTYHDPSNRFGGAYMVANKKEFLKRWAATYNHAQLIIAV